MDINLIIKIVRDALSRTKLDSLSDVYTSQKTDGTRVTDIDPFVEQIVLGHLLKLLPKSTAIIGEETSGNRLLPIGHICQVETIVTVDGIDGTDYFIKHCQDKEENDKWLMALTAVYQRNSITERFEPILAFAFQPQTDRLFCYAEGAATCIVHPLSNPTEYPLSVDYVNTAKIRGSIDVYLDQAQCPHSIAGSYVHQKGPSGFNMVSLLSSCNPNIAKIPHVNFSSFHYMVWDFGLWPILNAAGLATADYEHVQQRYDALDLNWFGQSDEPPGKIIRPVLIAPDQLMGSLVGVLTNKTF